MFEISKKAFFELFSDFDGYLYHDAYRIHCWDGVIEFGFSLIIEYDPVSCSTRHAFWSSGEGEGGGVKIKPFLVQKVELQKWSIPLLAKKEIIDEAIQQKSASVEVDFFGNKFYSKKEHFVFLYGRRYSLSLKDKRWYKSIKLEIDLEFDPNFSCLQNSHIWRVLNL